MIYIYPAIFSHCEVEERGTVYTVEIPDIPGCITEGESIQEAIAMGREALAGCILAIKQDNEEVPAPSEYRDITTESPDNFVTLLDVDLNEYLRKRETKSIIKTVSLPQWLAIMAEESGISYSQALQQALKQHLGIQD
ncbi:type II toxin-antitoxin system HicB family antitoxin [Syntrophomonas wolfei]|mgnify:CR=1 FL=1|jgi:predicted RNase H-like HicB family nuclease|uniref:type II toxin-antitoxin system HicB family antitoxin n=1 Tax=Syntrophomonas wolfei TaxID=863 RepID=UPI0023F14C44|nr:type II toxin-antitoxin system HicB family antitoxin [Syntrophomonas wolfei]MDD3909858.1 type II toxin-antitoxin system HicB family antitoxin [Proteiniphilum sp.]